MNCRGLCANFHVHLPNGTKSCLSQGLRKLNNLPEESEQKETRDEGNAGGDSAAEGTIDTPLAEVPDQVEQMETADADVEGNAEGSAQDAGAVEGAAGAEGGAEGAVEGAQEAEQADESVVEAVVEEKRNTRKRKADDQSEENKEAKK